MLPVAAFPLVSHASPFRLDPWTTTTSYDSMNRAVTVMAPLSRVTVYGYDATANLIKITDPMSQITSIAYDALNRPTVVTAPLTGSSNAVTKTQVIIGDD
jgi:YD repeat-containing protein